MDMSNSSISKLVTRARLAEQADRFEDMAVAMETLVAGLGHTSLTDEERNLLSVAFKQMVSSRRQAWRQLRAVADDSQRLGQYSAKAGSNSTHEVMEVTRQMIEEVAAEIVQQSNRALALVQEHLLPAAGTDESKVFFLKMAGDYLRYRSEVAEGDERRQLAADAQQHYENAYSLARANLQPTEPVALGMTLNYSVFLFEILNQPDKACRVAKEAFDAAIADLESLTEAKYKDATLIMQLIRDNLTLWTSEADQGND